MKLSKSLIVLSLLGLIGCASVKAPDMSGNLWSGQDGSRLSAQLRYTADQLPGGWLHKTGQGEASGSFVYRKRSDTYDYSEHGNFVVDPKWQNDREYIGLLKPGGIFCVSNPEQQSSETDDAGTNLTTITFWTIYDFCAELHRQ